MFIPVNRSSALRCVLVLSLFLLSLLALPTFVVAAKTSEEFNVEGDAVKKENIFNLLFGGAPLMPTQRGTVIVEAYHDKNDNQQRDVDEESLDKKVVCIVEEVAYTVPAFIPGLDNGMNYTILFEGNDYRPSIKQQDVFIKKRGQIIRIDIPCRPVEKNAAHHS